MANKKVDPLVKQVGVCGCVTQKTKDLLIMEASKQEVTIANVIGGILEGWAIGKMVDDKQKREGYLPYRHHQEEKGKKGGKEYKEGPLGMILKKKH